MSWSQRRLLAAIVFYQRAVEGRPSPCRFTPSCSSYAREAFELHGTGRGLWLTVRRLARCRPFGPSGFDPVPVPVHAIGAPDVHTCAEPGLTPRGIADEAIDAPRRVDSPSLTDRSVGVSPDTKDS